LADPANGLIYSERAIHEFVAISRGYETYVNVMAWRGLSDAAHMTARRGDRTKASLYESAAGQLQAAIVREMIDPETGSFVKRIHMGRRVALPAISALAPALFGAVEPHDPAVASSIKHLKQHIWDRHIGGLHRYPLSLQPWQEHPYGGPWITYTSWLGRIHLLRGELDEARELIAWALRNIPADSNLIPEHFSTAHTGKRGFHRIYLDPSTPELWATAEFLRFARLYRTAKASTDAVLA
jgi:GH15 family glucan-1,4-alpha-glucosidase